MKKHWADQFSFLGGVVKRKGLAFFSLAGEEAAEAKLRLAIFTAWRNGDWLNAGNQRWLCAGLTYIDEGKEQLLAVGDFGDVFVRGGGSEANEVVTEVEGGTRDRGPLRSVRRIGDSIYVAGMDRQVYVRTKGGIWKCVDAGAKPLIGSKAVVGFEAIDGFSENEIYAAGWEGEIWQFNGRKWSRRDSPTNVILMAMCCGGDGNVYIGGQSGTLLQGRKDDWALLELANLQDDVWDLAWYQDALYLSTTTDLYRYRNGELTFVDFGDHEPETFYKLSTGDGELWSIGAKDVMRFDGNQWHRIE